MYNTRSNLILGFHGCDKTVANNLLNNPFDVKISKKPFEWLGHGFYLWENNYKRALQWAKDKKDRGKIEEPTVIGAVVSLGHCLDLIDSEFIDLLSSNYISMEKDFAEFEKSLPQNKDVENDLHKDRLIRLLDCAVIEYTHQRISENIDSDNSATPFDTVRGVFTEGGEAFPGAGIKKKSHIQICVRNMNCIKGFFKPRIKNL